MKLKELCCERHMTLASLAERIGVTPVTLSRYVHGARKLPIDRAKQIAEILQVDWWKLYE